MATEELIVLLDAKTQKLDAKLRATEKRLDDLDGSTKKNDASLAKFSKVAGVAGTVITAVAGAAVALSGALIAMTLASASNRKELEILSRQAKTTAADFQALSFATNRYGINAAKIADISKDIADRVGEFSAAGTGVFQDYADVMKLSKEQARDAAEEFEGLSSQEILGRMVSRMEDASVSGDKMTFVLESLGDNSSRLIPLFSNNSAELLKLKQRFDDVNGSIQITGTQSKALEEVAQTFDLMKTSGGNAATAISATLAPVIDDFFNDIIAVVPDATQTIIDFINSFLDAENITSIAGVNKEMETSTKEIDRLTDMMNDKRQRAKHMIQDQLDSERQRLAELEAQLVVLTDQEKSIENANRLKGGEIGGATGSGGGSGTGDEIQRIADRFKDEETLLVEKLDRELEIVGENQTLRLELEQEFLDNLQAMHDEHREKKAEAQKKAEEDEFAHFQKMLGDSGKASDKNRKGEEKGKEQLARNAMILNEQVFDNNKAIGAGIIVAETAQNVVTSVKNSGGVPWGIPSGIAAAAMGMAQLAALKGASKGGGSIGASASAPAPAVPDFQQETSSLELSNGQGGGSSTIMFATDSGDALMDVIAEQLNKGRQQGRFA